MTRLAKALPVALVPEQAPVAAMRNDVIHHRGRGVPSSLKALNAEGMLPEIRFADLLPFDAIAPAARRPYVLRVQRLVLFTVSLGRLDQRGAARMPAWFVWSVWLGITSFEKNFLKYICKTLDNVN